MQETGLDLYNWIYLLMILGVLSATIVSARAKATFTKYKKIRNVSGVTGAQVAERILRSKGLTNVSIIRIVGNSTCHYRPKNKTLELSDSTYEHTSIVAVSVAAYECGHAIQHDKQYIPLTLRSYLVSFSNIGTKFGVPIIILGIVLSYNVLLIKIGIWFFAIAVLLQLVTLPIEFNATSRGIEELDHLEILSDSELKLGEKVLHATVLTCVTTTVIYVIFLLRFVMLFGN